MLSKYLNILIYKAILWYLLWKKEDSCRLSGPEKRCKYLASLLYNVMERNSYTTSLFNEYDRQKYPFWQPVFIAGIFAMHFVQPTRVLYYTGLRTFKSIFSNSELEVSAKFNCLTTRLSVLGHTVWTLFGFFWPPSDCVQTILNECTFGASFPPPSLPVAVILNVYQAFF